MPFKTLSSTTQELVREPQNGKSSMTYLERKNYQQSLCQWLCAHPADFFVTANFNKFELSHKEAKDKLNHFHAVLDRKLLGKNWSHKPDHRTRFVAVPEIKCGKLHYHMLLAIPDRSSHEKFKLDAPKLFRKKISVGGSLDIEPIQSDTGHRTVADYMTKVCYQAEAIENYVLSSEFVSSRCARVWPRL